jgi:cytochrome c oxidase subunit 3
MDEIKGAQNLKARKFMIWLTIASSFMLVAALTSVFIISTSSTNTVKVKLPYVFIGSTLVILASSFTLNLAGKYLKGLKKAKFHLYLKITIALGLLFMALQVLAWWQLIAQNIAFDMQKSYQSFIYIFVAVHFAHILAGIGLLLYTLAGSVTNKANYRILLRNEVSTYFWHFVDLMWLYLYFCLFIK